MTQPVPARPEHPRLTKPRISELAEHLARELHREGSSRQRMAHRKLVLAAAAALVLLTLVGAGYAVGREALHAFDFTGGPEDPRGSATAS